LSTSTRFRKKLINCSSRLRDLDKCDFIGAINGGDSFSDIYGLGRFVEGILPIIITILLGKSLILLPQTYGPYNSCLAKVIVRWIILRSAAVLSRDQDSIILIRDILGIRTTNVPVAFCPDVAFTLPSIFPKTYTIYPFADIFNNEELLGINVNGLLFQGGYTGRNMFGLRFEYSTFMLNLIEKMIRETSSKILLIPHTYGEKGNVNSDPEASTKVYDVLKDRYENRLYVLTGEYKETEIKGIIGCCDFFIGSRMHACIAAISQGVPTAALAYSKKFTGVFESVGLAQMVVDARLVDSGEAVRRIIDLYQNRKVEKISMSRKIDLAKMKVDETFTHLFNNTGLGNKASW
jgi:polysaccharide pyruvyl transferase WcaK-like protein